MKIKNEKINKILQKKLTIYLKLYRSLLLLKTVHNLC